MQGYIAVNGQPLLPPGMSELLHKDLDRGFDFAIEWCESMFSEMSAVSIIVREVVIQEIT